MAGFKAKKPSAATMRAAAGYKRYGAQASKQPGWGGMGAKAKKASGPKRMRAPKKK